MTKEYIEAEIVQEPTGFSYKEQYRTYNTEAKGISKLAWFLGVLSLPLALIPFFGFIFAIIALIINIAKKTPPILPIISLIISGLVSSFFAIIILLFSAIF